MSCTQLSAFGCSSSRRRQRCAPLPAQLRCRAILDPAPGLAHPGDIAVARKFDLEERHFPSIPGSELLLEESDNGLRNVQSMSHRWRSMLSTWHCWSCQTVFSAAWKSPQWKKRSEDSYVCDLMHHYTLRQLAAYRDQCESHVTHQNELYHAPRRMFARVIRDAAPRSMRGEAELTQDQVADRQYHFYDFSDEYMVCGTFFF